MSYEEDDEIDIRLSRRGRGSDAYDRPGLRPVYYDSAGRRLEVAGGVYERSRSRGRRPVSPAPAPAPVIINNRIYNEIDEDDDRPYRQLLPPARPRSRSRSRQRDREDYELDRTRRELEAYKIQAQREEDEKLYKLERTRKELEAYKMQVKREEDEKAYKRDMEYKRLRDEKRAEEEAKALKKEMELKRLLEEKKAEDEKKRAKEEADKAVKEWQIKEAEKKQKEKKEKEEREAEYKKRLEEDLRKSGLDDRQIAAILKKDKDAAGSARPTYTRMARRYLSIETLNAFRIDYTFDKDPEYILIKRAVPEYEQDFLWNHTRELRERRDRGSTVLLIEDRKHHHEKEYEFVRKKEQKRSKSPSPLIAFLAGGKGR